MFDKQSITTALLVSEVGVAARGAVVMDRDVARVEVMDRLEQSMLMELGVPVQVSWSFRLGELVCDRRDGRELTNAQCRAWALALEREAVR